MVILHTPISVYVHLDETRPQPVVLTFNEEAAYQIRNMAGDRDLSIQVLIMEALRLHVYWRRHGLYTKERSIITGI